jgi:hypothetical protein
MKPTEEQIRDFVNATLDEWIIYCISQLKASAKKRKLDLTEDTINSIVGQVIKSSASDLSGAVISFLPSGRIKDMKVVTHTKPLSREVIENEILKFVQKIGVSRFQRVPGYKGHFPIESIAAKRIAWGIGKGIMKGKWVRRAWYAKRISANIKNLTERLITDYATVIQTSTAMQIQNKN